MSSFFRQILIALVIPTLIIAGVSGMVFATDINQEIVSNNIGREAPAMENKQEQIKELLHHIMDKLEDLEQKIEKQNEDVRAFLAGRDTNYDPSSLLIAQQKATRTSVELLREEVDELHQIIRVILK